jgi:metal-responsive CopG/Arc/MetJ family transcriptional regulator
MVRITLRVDAALLADIDRHCRRLGCSRSAFIRAALHWHIDREQKKLRRRKGGQRLRKLVRRAPKGRRPREVDWGKPVGRETW